MKAKNQIAVMTGIVVILATVVIVGSYGMQTAKAEKDFGQSVKDLFDDLHDKGLNPKI